ncbi:Sensor histidine kinase [Pseudomonas savastanoi pv. glycinea]|uniref:histidine kinase n=2 Tax=Pseudomonas savastanoi TaxID=29438 RepID=A0A0P9QV61_PSESG|nr:ATP-binding protein [Pseudomonas savastanoi]EFW79740.1 sensor histidine kinase [Pseudomonas savastanoi pv. glycinea str. B076]KPC23123.1 Sensor histidine kinase [Pseudomonas savastanoi pv. glycinea]KPC25069.1 Sensor histidine kinase [Pseudomonas savastanoi pv. glycinea]KPC46942.1 Sensor histidine kinase [Pseudomonas savastanoi pv. glycinea]KPC51658.1 Sensor histidine kinase [Pseudomonas savastanoi pv. glycinea]
MRRFFRNRQKPLWHWVDMRMLAVGAVIVIAFCMWLHVTVSDWLTLQAMPADVRTEFIRLQAEPAMDMVKLRELFFEYYPIENLLPGIANKEWWVLAALVMMAIPIIIFFGFLFSRPLSSQFSSIAKGARQVAQGDFKTRLPMSDKDPDELQALVSDFNTMTTQLGRYELEVSESSAMIAHELRTPLNAAMGRIQGMIDEVFPRDLAQLEMVHRQLNQLNKLVSDLHLLSLASAGQLTLDKTVFSLEKLVAERLSWFAAQLDEAGVVVTIDIPQRLTVTADRDRIGQVVNILVDNALRYSAMGGELLIVGRARARSMELTVSDRGPGFGSENLEQVFDRFWRAERSRARYSGGSGLGLSIARAICLEHDGTIGVRNRPGGGSVIRLEIPA